MKKLLAILIMVILLQAVFLSKEVAYGESAYRLEREIMSLKKENQSLEILIASKTSLSSLLTKAEELGMDPVLTIAKNNETVAFNR